jgi:hypothetical protein
MRPTYSAESLVRNVLHMLEGIQAALPEGATEVLVSTANLFGMSEMLQAALHRLPGPSPDPEAPARGIVLGGQPGARVLDWCDCRLTYLGRLGRS